MQGRNPSIFYRFVDVFVPCCGDGSYENKIRVPPIPVHHALPPLPRNHVISRGPHTNPLHVDVDKLLNVLDVLFCVLRQSVPRLHACGRRLPARQRLIVYRDLAENVRVSGEILQCLPVVGIACGDLELVEVIQDVQLGEVDGRVVVARVAVLDDHEIQPTAAALPAGGDANLVADLLQLVAVGVELLGGEGPRADARGVGLHDADDLADGAPAEGQTGQDATEAGVGRGHEGVGAVVDIEHEGVCAFDEDGGFLVFGGGEQGHLVDDVVLQLGAVALEGVSGGRGRGESEGQEGVSCGRGRS